MHRQRTIRHVDLLDASHNSGVTLDELNTLNKLRQILCKIMIVDLKSLEHPLWGDGGGDFSQRVRLDTHDLVFPKRSRERYQKSR